MATSNKKGPNQRRRPPQRSNNGLIVIGIAGVVGIILAVVLGSSGDDDDAADAETADAETADIFHPVEVAGDALPAFTDDMNVGGAEDPAIGVEAPVVSGTDYEGNDVTIDASADGPTMVVLLAHWCPHCNREIPVLNEWRESGDVPEDLNVVGVSTGVSADRANYPPGEWLTSMDWQWPVLADGDISADDPADGADTAFRAYGGESFPTMILVGSDGEVLSRFSGEAPVETIQQRVDDALAQDAAS